MGVWGYVVLQETSWMPWYLAGSGTYEESVVDMPFSPCPESVHTYCLVFLALYSFQLVDLIHDRKARPDFDEMFVHHICSVLLTGGMILTNNRGPGIIAAYVHIWADIPVQVSRVLSTTQYAKATAASFIVLMIVWLWTRIFCVGLICWKTWIVLVYPQELYQFNVFTRIFSFYGTCLVFLHLYWTVLLIRMF